MDPTPALEGHQGGPGLDELIHHQQKLFGNHEDRAVNKSFVHFKVLLLI